MHAHGVGDSKLISYTNAAAMAAQGVGFVAPLAAARVPAGLFAALPPGAGTAVDYAARRDAGKTAATSANGRDRTQRISASSSVIG